MKTMFKQMKQWSAARNVNLTIVAIAFINAFTGIWAYNEASHLIELSNQTESHSRGIIDLESHLAGLRDVEIGQRGYGLTGDERFLQPYLTGQKIALDNMERMKVRFPKEKGEALEHKKLVEISERVLAINSSMVEQRKASGEPPSAEELAKSKANMDAARSLASEIKIAQEGTLAAIHRESKERAIRTLALLAGGALVSFAILFVTNFIVAFDRRKRVEAERKSIRDARLREAILKSANSIIITTSATGEIESINRFGENLLGFHIDELKRMDGALSLIAPEDLEAHIRGSYVSIERNRVSHWMFFTRLSRNGGVDEAEWSVVTRTGRKVPMHFSVTALSTDEDGGVSGYLLMGYDISEKKRSEEVVRSERRNLHEFLKKAPAAIAMLDNELRYITCSEKWLNDWGMKEQEVIGRKNFDVFPGMREKWEGRFARSLKGESQSSSEENYTRADGTDGYLRWGIHPWFNERSEVAGVIIYSEFIDDLVSARETALIGSRHKSEFLANMSHEIRTPLNAIIGSADLLAETSLSLDQSRYVNMFRRAGDSLLSLINDILDLSKIEAGQMDIEKTDFNLRELLERSVDMLADKAHGKGLELTLKVGATVPAMVTADSQRLRQILLNALGNAVKFTSKGSVDMAVNVIARKGSHCELHFEIRDTGIGIPQDRLESIFEAFTQVDSSTTRKFGGTGLGLNICRRLTGLMGGEIWIESELGKGSSVHLKLPVEIAEVEVETTLPNLASLMGQRILVVDDTEANREIARDYLTSFGADVHLAEDGIKALEKLEDAAASGKPFCMVILDSNMPGKNGFQVAAELHMKRSRDPIGILMLTSDSKLGDYQRAKEVGIDHYMVKPIKRDELLQSVSQALTGVKPSTQPRTIVKDAAPASEASKPNQQSVKPISLSILIVEDTEPNRDLIAAFLSSTGCKIEFAVNGLEGVEKFKAGAYDLVLMDMQMPVLDGYSATQTIRQWEQDQNRQRTPIIALTAHAMDVEVKRTLDAGCDRHLAKPLRRAQLLAVLTETSKLVKAA